MTRNQRAVHTPAVVCRAIYNSGVWRQRKVSLEYGKKSMRTPWIGDAHAITKQRR